jgi:uncharacterized membrane protein YdbT with pleckstrin-like domain
MNYQKTFDKILAPGEQVIEYFSIADGLWKLLLGITIFILLPTLFMGIGIILIPLAIFYFAYYLRISTLYIYTNKRIIIHKGWLSSAMASVDYDKITDIFVVEPFFERILTHAGDMRISSASGAGILLMSINSPYEKKKRLLEIIETLKSNPTPVPSPEEK